RGDYPHSRASPGWKSRSGLSIGGRSGKGPANREAHSLVSSGSDDCRPPLPTASRLRVGTPLHFLVLRQVRCCWRNQAAVASGAINRAKGDVRVRSRLLGEPVADAQDVQGGCGGEVRRVVVASLGQVNLVADPGRRLLAGMARLGVVRLA